MKVTDCSYEEFRIRGKEGHVTKRKVTLGGKYSAVSERRAVVVDATY